MTRAIYTVNVHVNLLQVNGMNVQVVCAEANK